MGTGVVYGKCKNEYVSLLSAVNTLPSADKQRLANEINNIVSALSYEDAAIIGSVLVSGSSLAGLSSVGRAALVSGIQTFFRNTGYNIHGS